MGKSKRKSDTKDDGELDKKQRRVLKLLKAHDRFGIFLGAGSGKTRIGIRHAIRLMKRDKKLNCLVVSTKANTLDTWPAQFKEQMRLLGVSLTLHVHHKEYKQVTIAGTNCQYSARVQVCNFEGLGNLLWHYEHDYFGILLVDESVRVKNWKAKATAIICAFADSARYVYPLSGLPSPNRIVDLFAQVFLIDGGERLGENITAFRHTYMQQGFGNRNVWHTRGYPSKTKMEQTEQEVLAKIADICVTEETETFVKDLVDVKYRVQTFELSKKQRRQYDEFEKNALLELEDADNIAAASGMVLRMKLLQFVSGNIYSDPDEDKPRTVIRTNRRRAQAFDEFMSKRYKRGTKIIVAYGFKHSIPDIVQVATKHVRRSKILVVDQRVSVGQITREWNSGRCDVLVGHAASIGHGLNLQKHGGQVLFYSLTDNYDHYYQLIRRIRRRGNPEKVCHVTTLACKDTADELVVDNIVSKAALGKRVMSAVSIVKALQRLREKRKTVA